MKKYFCQARIRRVVKEKSWIAAKEKFNSMVENAFYCGSLNQIVRLMTKKRVG